MARHNDIGKLGEEKACEYLISQGYKILETNYRYKNTEVDVISIKDKVVVFVEVKARINDSNRRENLITQQKINSLLKASEGYRLAKEYEEEIEFHLVCVFFSKDLEQCFFEIYTDLVSGLEIE